MSRTKPRRGAAADGAKPRQVAAAADLSPRAPACDDSQRGEQGARSPAPRSDAIFDLLFLQGVLDTVDMTVLAFCSWEMYSTRKFWDGVRAQNPTTRLHLIEQLVEDLARNDTRYPEYVPVSAGGRKAAP